MLDMITDFLAPPQVVKKWLWVMGLNLLVPGTGFFCIGCKKLGASFFIIGVFLSAAIIGTGYVCDGDKGAHIWGAMVLFQVLFLVIVFMISFMCINNSYHLNYKYLNYSIFTVIVISIFVYWLPNFNFELALVADEVVSKDIKPWDVLVVDRLAYQKSEIQIGDVVQLATKGDGYRTLSRVIAGPGGSFCYQNSDQKIAPLVRVDRNCSALQIHLGSNEYILSDELKFTDDGNILLKKYDTVNRSKIIGKILFVLLSPDATKVLRPWTQLIATRCEPRRVSPWRESLSRVFHNASRCEKSV